MIKFFRKIRQKLLSENKLSKYLVYAIGEIILVVIGILIALQVNNWNEDKKKQKHFHGILNQIYNSIYIDNQWQLSTIVNINTQTYLLDTLIATPEKIDPKKLIHIIYYMDSEPKISKPNTRTLLQYLDLNSNDKRQNEITQQLVSYGGDMFDEQSSNEKMGSELVSILRKHNIPEPPLIFNFSSYHNFTNIDTSFYSEHEIKKVQQIIKGPDFKSALRTTKTNKINAMAAPNLKMAENEKYLKLIKDTYPFMNLLFNDISVIGSALETGWDKSIPMQLINTDQNIWQINLQVNDGYIKFRNGENWAYNWGGKTFPNGQALFFGQDITVKAGHYQIILDLDNNSYDFIETE